MDERPFRHNRPWPVSAHDYPLDGPTKGRTYCPPLPGMYRRKISAGRVFLSIVLLALGGMAWVVIFAVFEYLFLPINY